MHACLKVYLMDELDLGSMASQGLVEEPATKAHCIPSTTDLLAMLCQLLQIEEKQPKWWRWLVALWRGPSCKTMPSIAVIVTDQRNKKLNALLLSFQFELSRVPFRWAEFGWWINWNKIEWEFVWYGWWKVGGSPRHIYRERVLFVLNWPVLHFLRLMNCLAWLGRVLPTILLRQH